MLRNDNSYSSSGMPDQPPDQDHCEPGIFPLVESLTRAGFRTRASCQGHYHWLFGCTEPYVAFTGSCSQALTLNNHLTDLVSQGGLYWELIATFGPDNQLWYRISPRFQHASHLSWLPAFALKRLWRGYLARVEIDQQAISDFLRTPGVCSP